MARQLRLKGWVCWHKRCQKHVTIYRDQMESSRKHGATIVPVEIVEIRISTKR